jgi:hypothetical protein
MVDKVYFCEQVLLYTRESITASDCINAIARRYNPHIRQFSQEECQGIFSNLAVELFADSHPERKRDRPDYIGNKADKIIDSFANSEVYENLEDATCTNLLMSHPYIAITADIGETYLKVYEKALKQDTIGGGEWSLVFKHSQLPITDSLFSRRENDSIALGASVLVKKLKERLDLIYMYNM